MKVIRLIVTAVVLVLAWGLIAWGLDLPRFILPSPLAVLKTTLTKYDIILGHALTTALEIFLGLVLGVSLGCLSALIISANRGIKRWIMPVLIASQAIPVFAIAPLLVLWFDYGITSKVVMATLIIYFPVTVSFLDGLNRTDPAWLDMATLMQQGGSPSRLLKAYRLYRYIKIPFALPSLASGLRVATAVAPIGAVVGEWVGSSSGLGYLMLHANGRMQTDLMFAALLVLAFMAISLFYLVDYVLRLALRWQPDQHSVYD
ncbi:ABC transporter permease [Sneathiella chinensis]|uniref:ABC transporter permease n=1 Tax=Sneathiella chinensis TaxID=349750 RepID=A0ABQ5U5H3_9PROT|nr:ABC transporter permease [Sneathiella chinensis]GLQ07103.1 ABC transporter permease [Sneathiella chinensis]